VNRHQRCRGERQRNIYQLGERRRTALLAGFAALFRARTDESVSIRQRHQALPATEGTAIGATSVRHLAIVRLRVRRPPLARES
jgi:hypothetical protein